MTEYYGHKVLSYSSRITKYPENNYLFYCSINMKRIVHGLYGGTATDSWGVNSYARNVTSSTPAECTYNIESGEYECPSTESTSRQLGESKNPSCAPSSWAGNPVNIGTGNKFQEETDIFKDVLSPLALKRYFNSLDGTWHLSYSDTLTLDKTTAVLKASDGRHTIFGIQGTTILPIGKEVGTLERIANGWQYSAPDGRILEFDQQGRLTATQEHGRKLKISYPSYGIMEVRDDQDRTLSIQMGAYQQPKRATSSTGLDIQYEYDTSWRLLSVKKIYRGATSIRKYQYESPVNGNLLTGITDENGIRFATWGYDDKGRAIFSEHANGAERVNLAYNADGSTTVTNEYGKKATYRFQVIQGIKRITSIEGEPTPNCPYSNSTFTYDDRGLLKTQTDAKGNLTTYAYNDRGLEVSRTEASGTSQARTISTEWHPTLFLKTQVTEPGRVIRYQYDDQGRQIGQTATSL